MTRRFSVAPGVCAIVLAGGMTLAGCGGKEPDAPPVATPTVTLDRDKLPVGGVATITYKFVVADGATFDKDYLVFAQVKDADGETIWDDDHRPETPTSQWKPGQTIEYSRLVFIPALPYIGEAALDMGLYPPDGGERLPLGGEHMGQRAYRVARFELLPQTDNLYTVYRDGWYRPEVPKPGAPVVWQWTRQEAALAFKNTRKDMTLYLDLDGAGSPYPSQEVKVILGGQSVETFSLMANARQVRKILLPASLMGTEELSELRLSVDKTFVPAQAVAGSRDTRTLGVRVLHLYIDSR